jgi:hypothetical protein
VLVLTELEAAAEAKFLYEALAVDCVPCLPALAGALGLPRSVSQNPDCCRLEEDAQAIEYQAPCGIDDVEAQHPFRCGGGGKALKLLPRRRWLQAARTARLVLSEVGTRLGALHMHRVKPLRWSLLLLQPREEATAERPLKFLIP